MAEYQIIEKPCKKCGSNPARYEKVAEGYYRGICDKCYSAAKKANWKRRTDEGKDLPRSKALDRPCRKCSVQPATYRFKPSNPDGYDVVCVDCKNAQSYAWRARQPAATQDEIDTRNQKAKAKRDELKREVFGAYGGECYCCHLKDIRFLTLDHINGDGAEHRKRENTKSGQHTYKWIKKNNFPQDIFRVACFNCNCAAFANNNICPHQEA